MSFICPVCQSPIIKREKNFVCENGHNFDIAKSGYVNLLLGSSPKNHGDNKLMALARRDFLAKDFYAPLKDTICKTICDFAIDGSVILDCGCGEGYYTSAISECAEKSAVFGTDISKDELSIAAKRDKLTSYAVASSFSLPFSDESVDILLEIFSPYCDAEFKRVLKKDGIMVIVYPLENHLWELKQAIYANPYKNEVADTSVSGFELIRNYEVKMLLDLQSQNDIKNLFMMTPYYYKTSEKDQKKIEKLDSLAVNAQFGISVYKKI